MKKLFFLIPVLWAAVSCGERDQVAKDTILYVKQLAADTTGIFSLVSAYRTAGTEGSITLIGEPEDCLLLSERFLSIDEVDNIDGVPKQDRLPDFAGEVFDVLMDAYNEPYLGLAASSPDSLREAAVRNAVMAVDTVAFANAYDRQARLNKNKAKVLVLASSALAGYGRFDIDTLFKMAGREPLILTPVESSVAAVKMLSHVVVWAPALLKEAYAEAALRYAPSTDITVLSPAEDDPRNAFRELLRMYREAKPNTRLDAVIVDRLSMDMTALDDEREHIYRKITEEDMAFDRMLAPTFRFVNPKDCLVAACYRLLRERNLFTHNIAYPSARYYQTEEGPDGEALPVEISASFLASRTGSASWITPDEAPYLHVPDND